MKQLATTSGVAVS